MRRKAIATDAELQTTIERVTQMEQYMDEVRNAVNNGVSAITDDNVIKEKIVILTQYYEGGQWLQDYDCDARGELPEDLKRGVLSQDGLYDLLREVDEQKALRKRMNKMIIYKEVDKTYFALYDTVPQNVDVRSEYKVQRVNNGLGGLILEEIPVESYVKDLSKYERATEYEKRFDITNWRFYMAFDGEIPVGAMTIAGTTKGLHMLYGRTDACVLWDIRVADAYKHQGIGQKLLDMGIAGAKEKGYHQMIIECQNNNVPACRFYQKQGAVLAKIDMYAYYSDPAIRDEVQFVWYLDI